MADFPSLRGGGNRVQVPTLGVSTQITTVTAHASANTKGSYVEIVATTSFPSIGLLFSFEQGSLSGDALLDIAIGAGGSEQPIIENMLVSGVSPLRLGASIFIPISIPSGSRISMRMQSATGGQAIFAALYPVGGSLLTTGGFHRSVNLGANTGDSGGVQVDPGGTINTKGAYSELSSSLAIPVSYVLVMLGNQSNSVVSNARWNMDIAIGAGGSEQVVIPDLHFATHTTTDTIFPFFFGFPVSIPQGQRISARAQCDINDATDRLFDVVLIGLN